MKLKLITFTGADDSTDQKELMKISLDYPFVEWGILVSKNQEGNSRYPSGKWVDELLCLRTRNTNLSAHLCGRYARSVVQDHDFTWAKEKPHLNGFDRVQLNFSIPSTELDGLKLGVDLLGYKHQFIIQENNVNQDFWTKPHAVGANVVPLFDKSGGEGVSPEKWPNHYPDVLCGYAGGLNPINLEKNLEMLVKHHPTDHFWVDMETGVRTEDKFDLDKVLTCIKIATKHIL